VALVGRLSAGAQADENFGPTILEIHLERDDGVALALHFLSKFPNFAFMCKKSANTDRCVLECLARCRIFRNMHRMERKGRRLRSGADITLCQADFSGTNALYFGAEELNAAFQGFGDLVVMPRLAIFDRRLVWDMFLGTSSHGMSIGGCATCPPIGQEDVKEPSSRRLPQPVVSATIG
jgi:hypothetical protein